jgi:hypothetical protein
MGKYFNGVGSPPIRTGKDILRTGKNDLGAKMAKDLMKYLETVKPRGFEPCPYYGAEEDCLTFYFDKAESYGKRVDDLLTLFLSVKNDELVGCQVKGVRKYLKRLGHFGIGIKHGKVRLDLFFHLLAFLADNRNSAKNTWT